MHARYRPDVAAAASESGPVFVGGVVPDATRRVQAALAAHPALGRDLDFALYAELVELRRRMRRSIERGFIDLFCNAEELDQRLRAWRDGLDVPDTGAGLRLCEGEPDSGARLAELAALFPNARLVHVVGDPRRAVAAELTSDAPSEGRGPMADWTRLEAALRRVRTALDAAFEAARAAPERVLAISMARLAGDPEAEARRLCAFLDLPWDAALRAPLEAAAAADAAPGDALSAGARVWLAGQLGGHPELRALGYDLRDARLPAPQRLWGVLASRLGAASLAARRRVRAARRPRGVGAVGGKRPEGARSEGEPSEAERARGST